MKALSNINYPIIVELYIDDIFKFNHEAMSNESIKDLKNSISKLTEINNKNYVLLYNNRDYTTFETFKLKEIFMFRKEVKIYIKTLTSTIKGIYLLNLIRSKKTKKYFSHMLKEHLIFWFIEYSVKI